MPRKNGGGGAPSRGNSDDSDSPSSVLGGCTTSSTTTDGSSSSAAATYNTDPSISPPATSPSPAPAPAPWKSVADAWRGRTRRRISSGIPSLAPAMSSTLQRLSVRRPWPDPGGGAAAAVDGEVHEFCVLKPTLRTFSLAELKRTTGNFSRDNVVGRGGFAKVYRGSLPGGELVAVKRLTAAQGSERMEGFLAELGHVVNVSHPNIARLVGVGVDGGEHLVFPFSRLGCLSGKLHGGAGAPPMPWAARHRVAVGVARGLEYLHERCARRIVHRDIKPANILLMDDYEPLICDFGLARWLPAKVTHLQITAFEGTFGYVPPEYTTHGVFNEKTDVFALGVVLLELLTGRRAVDAAKLSLVSWAKMFIDDEEEALKMADPALGGQYDAGQLSDMAWAAKLSIDPCPDLRPRMSEVVQILRGLGAHQWSLGRNKSTVDDLIRHKAIAFDFD
ncbi:hypothetical protein ACP4OV_002043 [Aristida adscensionis]